MIKRRHYFFLLTPTILLISLPLATSICYFPNERSYDDPAYQACPYSNNGIKMCCNLNGPNEFGGNSKDDPTRDNCLSNGLCINEAEITNDNGSTYTQTQFWRDMCTTPYWDDGCLNICTDTTKNGSDRSNVRMTPCDGTLNSETWCCGPDNIDCCGTTNALTLGAFGVETTTSATASASVIASTTASSSPSATKLQGSDSSSNTGLSNGAKAGIRVGVAVGVIAIIAALAFLFVRWRRQKPGEANMAGVEPAAGPVYQVYATVQSPRELDGNGNTVYEKAAGAEDTRHELPGESEHR